MTRNMFYSHLSLPVRFNAAYKKEIELDPGDELSIKIGTGEVVQLELESGYADIFGSKLKMKEPYVFKSSTNVSIFTHQGCRLILQIPDDRTSINKETSLMSYLKYHYYLEKLRRTAEQNNCKGPVTVVVGPKNVGKSTVCRVLLNYAVQTKSSLRTPIFVDLDVGQSHISVPGTVGAMIVTQAAPVCENFAHEHFPIIYHFGHVNLRENPKLFDTIVFRLAEKIHELMENDLRAKISGVIINTLGWIRNRGYLHILHIIREFQADNVIVLHDEELANKLTNSLPPSVAVTRLPKNPGIETISSTARVETRKNRVQEYFYRSSMSRPHSFEVDFSNIKICRIEVPAPELCAPFGSKIDNYPLKAVTVKPDANILHHILAVSNGPTLDDVIDNIVTDFVCVTKVDAKKRKIAILSLRHQDLGDKYLLLSDVKMHDIDN